MQGGRDGGRERERERASESERESERGRGRERCADTHTHTHTTTAGQTEGLQARLQPSKGLLSKPADLELVYKFNIVVTNAKKCISLDSSTDMCSTAGQEQKLEREQNALLMQ